VVIALDPLVGLGAISANLWPYIGMRKPMKDERAARAGAKAGLAAWYISLISTVVLAVVLGYLPASYGVHPTPAQVFGIVIAIMAVSMVGLYEYMIRKSDLGW
jgi:membrane protein YdbS with pleckstrin-like domain